MYSLVYEICRNKIDDLINFSLQNFNWVARKPSKQPNAYCESLIEYMRYAFTSLSSMDEGSRAGLHFSCCGHITERLVNLLSGKAKQNANSTSGAFTRMNSRNSDDDTINDALNYSNNGMTMDDKDGDEFAGGLMPIQRIDAFGLKNLSLDVAEFEEFANSTGVPQLGECFNELKCLVHAMLDKDLPVLLLPENEMARRNKYPLLNLEKIVNIFDKYVGVGLGDKLLMSTKIGGGNHGNDRRKRGEGDMLVLEKKDIAQLIKIVNRQIES